ncbi:MAG: polysaccharide deacetylase family protein [bacterium]
MRTTTLFMILVGALAVTVPAETLQEKLGYSPSDRLLIIHGDDLGMSRAVNAATIHAMEEGLLTSGSIMMPGPWVPEIVTYAHEHPEADFGIHLTLNSEWRNCRWSAISARDSVPGLLDPRGYLWGRIQDTATRATPDEVKRELRAQVRLALHTGIRLTHLDTHLGTIFARKEFLEAALDISEEFRIPMMVPDPTPAVLRRWGTYNYLTPEFIEKVKARGTLMLAGLYASNEFADETSTRRDYERIIRNLPSGISQLVLHLGKESDELKAMTDSWRIRTIEYAIMIDPETRKIIDEAGVKLVGWREIQEAWRSP